MSHPLLWLLGFLALDKFNQQSREIAECKRKLHCLEHGDTPDNDAVKETSSADGCAGLFFLLLMGIPLVCALIYGLFFTHGGLYILGASAAILFLVLASKKSPLALVVLFLSASALIFSAHDIWAVLFFWFVSAIITWVILKVARYRQQGA